MKLKAIIAGALALMTLFCSLGCAPKGEPDPIADNYRVFYQIFVGSFSDSDGDGTGDIRGIIERMDYLNDGNVNSTESLGVQGIWLSPIFKSPSYHKYDVTDYYTIDPKFGTEEDLVELIDLCHERNVKVILDLALNHTSTSNLWFSKFCTAHRDGAVNDPYYDYYTHCPVTDVPNGRAFQPIPNSPLEMYECNFSSDMPELNYDNPDVRQEAVNIAKHYIDLGVDGFRFDAIKYIYYTETERSCDFWDWYMEQLFAMKPDIYCVGECWSADNETLAYVESLNCFNFQMAQGEGMISNTAKGASMATFTQYVEKYSRQVEDANPNGMMIPFISNHDMDRSAGYLMMANKLCYMAANLYLLCCGSPFIYYGEEIGMKGTRGGASTDANRRLAMLWGDDDTVKNPVGSSYAADKQTNGTVAEQDKDPDSLLNYYRRLITIRNTYPEIARGAYTSLMYDDNRFGGFLVRYEGSAIGIFHNTSNRTITIDLADSINAYDYTFTELCESIGQGDASLEGTVLTIAPQTSVIVK